MTTRLKNQTLALAGVLQAATLVKDLAKHGQCDDTAFNASINSIYQLNADDISTIYGDTSNIYEGLTVLKRFFNNTKNFSSQDTVRYFLGLLHLERKLIKSPDRLQKIKQGIEQAIKQCDFFNDKTHPSIIANLADLYVKTLSSFKFRIMIQGDVNYLQQQDIVERIRALLLAGIRSAVLWQQLGGKRWHLLFKRKKILNSVNQLLGYSC